MKHRLHTAITNALRTAGVPDISFTIECPGGREHGDYATNAALVAAKKTGKPVGEIADTLRGLLESGDDAVERVEVAGPGFLNMHLSRAFFAGAVERACVEGGRLGGGGTSGGGGGNAPDGDDDGDTSGGGRRQCPGRRRRRR